ncbi:hypothetical protein [Cohnella sp.]|uniref:hypothetical protein n=1 Tax=Cohnella sp. TaxID=1883426 RepID=UPI0035665D1E
MKHFSLITFLVTTLILASCTNNNSNNTSSPTGTPTSTPNLAVASNDTIPSGTTEVSTESEVPEIEVPESEYPDVNSSEVGKVLEDKYYSIKSNKSLVQLRNDEESVLNILGKPIKETTPKQLGDGADTFSEMYSKTISYEGLSLRFLGMSEEELWLAEIEISSNKYQTSEGIKIGDSLNSLLNAYPNIKYKDTTIIEEKPNTKVYGFWQDYLGFFADFLIDENENIEEIHMYFVFD